MPRRVLTLLLAGLGAWAPTPVSAQESPASADRAPRGPTAEVLQVIDGDTLAVELAGRRETVRLLSVDTEEKITGKPSGSTSKPETVFGQETALWARAFFEDLRAGDVRARIELLFPGGAERRDAFGRILAHVLLPDGRDFGLLLVELGKSPYFTKYGYDELRHADFVRAEAAARERKLGIWDPATNRARTPGAPEVVRPYARLLPWWHARAEAVESFRAAARERPGRVLAADDAAGLETALDGPPADVEVFGEVERFYDERDGSLSVRFQATDPERALRVSLAAADRSGPLEARLRASRAEYRQNYWWVRGRLARGERGPLLETAGPDAWRLAGPEPDEPARSDGR
jgi:endonuclease YncB( thermonuclease family)